MSSKEELLASLEGAWMEAPDILEAAACDLKRTLELDPASGTFLTIYLNFKGFHAVQCARVGHHCVDK